MKHIKTLITITAAALLIISISTGAAAADNVTNSSIEPGTSYEPGMSYEPGTSYEYKQNLNAWYKYYKSLQEPNVGKTLRTKIYDLLMDSSLSWYAKHALIKSLMGCDYRLITYLNPATFIANEDGTLTYNLHALDWWDKPVVKFDEYADFLLPKEEVEALYKMYREKYDEYVYASLLQAQAEGDALYRVYIENDAEYKNAYDEYKNALRDARNSTRNP